MVLKPPKKPSIELCFFNSLSLIMRGAQGGESAGDGTWEGARQQRGSDAVGHVEGAGVGVGVQRKVLRGGALHSAGAGAGFFFFRTERGLAGAIA